MHLDHLRPRDIALALIVVCVWGVNFAVMKIGLTQVPPLMLVALRFLLAAFPALLFVRPPKIALRYYVLYGLSIGVGQFSMLFTALYVGMPTGLASLVLQSQAFFTMILAALVLKEHWKINQLAGLLLAACGLILIGSTHGASMPLMGFLLTIAAATMWACGNIVTRAMAGRGPINQFGFVVWSSLVPPIPLLVMSYTFEGPAAMQQALQGFTTQTFAAVAYLAWVSTLLGYGLWTYLLSHYPANRVAPFSLLVPLVGLTTGWLVFGEVLTPLHLAGGALLMVGLLFNLFGGQLSTRLRSFAQAAKPERVQ
jgi:O-acetylserine/cysteine efflux transporter